LLRHVHSAEHIEQVKNACALEHSLDGDTQTSKDSFQAALAAVTASVKAAYCQGFAFVRPPGHHAYSYKSSGFCLFNGIAVAVQAMINEGKRVLILDFDGHLGDGTSDIFYQSDQVLFCSLHQYPAFPGNGWVDEIGSGSGKGFTVNIPMPPGSGDDLFKQGLEFLVPIAHQFKPQVVAVSAGFDGHILDPLLQLNYSLNSFYHCGRWLSNHFDHTFAVLEGGYNLEVLPKAIKQFVAGVNQQDPPYQEKSTYSTAAVLNKFNDNIEQLHEQLRPYWSI